MTDGGSPLRQHLLDGFTLIALLAAIGISWLAFRRQAGPESFDREERRIENWDEDRIAGRSLGEGLGSLTLVEFGDYECPVCRAYEPWLRGLLNEFSGKLRVLFAHYPLSYHRAAYPAARAAECAASQGVFSAFHEKLMSEDEWMLNAQREFERIAEAVGVSDLASFRACITDSGQVPIVERHRKLGEDLRIEGIPALILDGVILGSVDSTSLAERIRTTLERPEK